MTKFHFIICLLLFILLLNLSCKDNVKPEDFDKKNTIFLPLIDEDITLNPLKFRNTTSNKIIKFLFEPLVEVDEKGEIIPNLISEWFVSEHGLLWNFTLRKDVYWSDGEKMNSDDVIFTLNYLKDPNLCPFYADSFKIIHTVEKIDEYGFKVRLKEVYTPFLVMLHNVYPVPEHIVNKSGLLKFSRYPSGNGPYVLRNFNMKSFVCLSRNKKYWKDRSLTEIENVVFRIYDYKTKAFEAFLSGDLDILDEMSLEDYRELKEKNFKLYNYSDAGYMCMGFNFKKTPLFLDVKVRQAISYSIDRDIMVHYLLHNLGEISYGPIYPFMSTWYNKDIKKYTFNPDKTTELMKEAGWHKGEKGYFEKKGENFNFKIAAGKGNSLHERTVTILAENLLEAGFAVEPVFMEWNEFVKSIMNGKLDSWCAYLFGGGIDPDNITYYYYYSGLTPEKGNYGFYSNCEVDKILTLARKELNRDKRIDMYYKLQAILGEDLPVIYIYSCDSLIAVNKRIEIPSGTDPRPLRGYRDFSKWNIISER
ncbi:MAG TPA: ABC transporter substrate-binding protein [Candidatus Eremiobacteraeota bacterium]|nr:MAG: Oligopeptide-binding protein AppA precursor [bacterium ADurb.Bin363]HPZ09337.1 ABC transporter substrate-binding protein [Candidatus Eremiobacteraeota bacterium]